MGVQTVEVSSANRPGAGSLMSPAPPATGVATGTNDVEKGTTGQKSGDQWGKNMQRWRNDNIDIGKGEDNRGRGIRKRLC
ncbi:hypothetical protein OUZ56_025066 [Daphnia magna]|uniref:Uncharacterized protein n=1 Tax=Daphnia magna TaxID=35525 RepID=A0ABQ9ZIR7_9CRUS|nr:hypothetical protein OUZ56_025066 [Daphnia magna]